MGKSASNKGPKTSCETRNNQNTESDPINNSSITKELELLAIKNKNSDLIRAYAKLNHDYYELSRENIELKKDLIELQSEHQSQGYAYKNLVSELKKCTPSLIEIINILLKVTQNDANTMGLTPKTKAVTQPVKPHTVNGTVLMNPTISLTRMPGSGNDSVTESCLPSTSSGSREYIPFVRNIVPVENHDDDDETSEDSFDEDGFQDVRRSSSQMNTSLGLHDSNPESSEVTDFDGEENEPVNEHNSSKELSTILEESRTGSIGEVRIFLSRLSDQDVELETQNNTRTSIEASVADNTYLNIETTLIENQLAGGRLRTDIMVFSPRGNSTRLETISPYAEKDLDKFKDSSGEIQSSVVTPSININESFSMFESRIPTPSMSLLGDIDKGSSRLAILAEDSDESPLVTASTVTKRARGKSSKRQRADRFHNGDSSPLSARSSNVSRTSTLNFVCSHRGGSSDSISLLATPTVVLEKLEHMNTTPVSASSALINGGEEVENEEPKQSSKPRSRKTSKASKSTSKSPDREAKRAKIDHIDHETIRDIQIRLSQVVSRDSLEQKDKKETTSEGSRRPQRAAKPKNLKDLSLKCKMRRMF